jgi:hypothetical protein
MMLRQLVNKNYTRNGKCVREHILKMINEVSKLKPLDEELERAYAPCSLGYGFSAKGV